MPLQYVKEKYDPAEAGRYMLQMRSAPGWLDDLTKSAEGRGLLYQLAETHGRARRKGGGDSAIRFFVFHRAWRGGG